jgi:hypothetical protein
MMADNVVEVRWFPAREIITYWVSRRLETMTRSASMSVMAARRRK